MSESKATGGQNLPGGVAPTGDKPSAEAVEMNEAVKEIAEASVNTHATDPQYNPTTPDGKPPKNNLPGPHGLQGVAHLQEDPTE